MKSAFVVAFRQVMSLRACCLLSGLCLLGMAIPAAAADEPAASQSVSAQTELSATAALAQLDLVALRRDVSAWRGGFSGPLSAKVNDHAAQIQQLIDNLTLLQRQAKAASASATAEANGLEAQVERELQRLNGMWPAWLQAGFDPPPSVRTISVRTAAELTAAFRQAQPGDEIILADGAWDVSHFPGSDQLTGSAVRPIIVRAQIPGRAVLTGPGPGRVLAANVIFRDLGFRDIDAADGVGIEFSGNSLRISQCAFSGQHPSGSVVLNAVGSRFDRNYVAGQFNGNAVEIRASHVQLDGNTFGWTKNVLNSGSNAGDTNAAAFAAVVTTQQARGTVVKSNLFSGVNATLLLAGPEALVADNTFQNVPQVALRVAPTAIACVIRENLAFDIGGFHIDAATARLNDNYLEHGHVSGAAAFTAEHNTLVVAEDFDLATAPQLQAGRQNLVCTEAHFLWPSERLSDVQSAQGDSEEQNEVVIIRDVLGYLRPHARYGRLGFQGESLPLGRSSEIGPAWLPAALAINRPLVSDLHFASPAELGSAALTGELLAISAEGAPLETGQHAELTSENWTLQGWIQLPREQYSEGVLIDGRSELGHWELRLTSDQRLQLSGETGGAAWSFVTEPEFEADAGRCFFAVIAEHRAGEHELRFYRGTETEAVDLIAVESAGQALRGPWKLTFPSIQGALPGLESVRVFDSGAEASEPTGPALGVLDSSDLEAVRQGDLR